MALETKISSNCNLTFGAKWSITCPAFFDTKVNRLGRGTSSLRLVDQQLNGPFHAEFLLTTTGILSL